MTAWDMERPCSVYRCYVEDECLYIGAAADPAARLDQHRAQKPWGWSVERMEVVPFATRREALAFEAEEIKRLRPRWNIGGRGPRKGWSLCDYVEVILATEATIFPRNTHNPEFTAWTRKRMARLRHELELRFPDVGPVVLADMDAGS